jgi:hypothetical protein
VQYFGRWTDPGYVGIEEGLCKMSRFGEETIPCVSFILGAISDDNSQIIALQLKKK